MDHARMAPPKTDIANAVSFGVFATDANEDDDDTTLHQKVRADSGGAAAAAFTMAPPPSERISRLTSGSSSIGDASSDGGGMPPVLSRPYSRSLDLSMDKITMREQTITEVDVDKQEARSQWAKFLASTPNGASSSSQSHVADPNLSQRDKQYRIRSRFVRIGRRKKQTWWKEQTTSTVSRYLAWTYRAPFAIVIVTSYVWFMLLTVVFAAFIYIAARHQPGCITTATFTFMDSFHLSWTTLGTVGYGAVSPTMATTEQRCFGVNSLMAFEAFVGLLFGGVSAAIIFGKMARIQSIAQVRFSHSMCIRFGTAVLDSGGLVDETENGGVEHHGFPCPILEFRVINLLSSQKGGAILNASVRIVASVLDNDEESENVKSLLKVKPSRRTTLQAAKSARGSAMESIRSMTAIAGSRVANRTGGALFADKRTTQPTSGSLVQQLNRQLLWQPHDLDDMIDEAVPYSEQGETIPSHDAVETRHDQTNDTSGMESPKAFAAVDEGNALLAPPRVYHRLEIEADKHPYFKRAWNIRHVLNQSSPLLSCQARQSIVDNNGYWPDSLNNHEAVRASIRFNDCVVSFSGTANACGSHVYAQKVYDFADMHVGYSFANMLTVRQGSIVMDSSLLNVVHEQVGGGAEPIATPSAVDG